MSIKTKLLIAVGIFLLVIFIAFLYFHFVVGPLVATVSRAQVDSVATTAVSDAIYEVMEENNYTYEDFLDVKYSSDGNVASVVAKPVAVNYFARQLSTSAQIMLDDMPKTIKVPMGSFSGINALSGIGPKVNVQLVPIGSIITSFSSQLSSAGINSTLLSIYIDVSASVSVVLPLATQKVDFITQVLICEFVINGKVPQVYLGVQK